VRAVFDAAKTTPSPAQDARARQQAIRPSPVSIVGRTDFVAGELGGPEDAGVTDVVAIPFGESERANSVNVVLAW
jgi:hypothetical protein